MTALSLRAGLAVGAAILLAAGRATVDVVGLALIGAVTFADLSRRGLSERARGASDPTDVGLSTAFAAILVGAAYDLGRGPIARLAPETRTLLAGVGLFAIAAGVGLRQWAARELGESFLVRLGIREGHTLVQSGPFRMIRHPTYAGLLAVALGTSLALASPTAALLTVGLWLPVMLVRVGREERLLARTFPDEFEAYRARTWRLVPGLW